MAPLSPSKMMPLHTPDVLPLWSAMELAKITALPLSVRKVQLPSPYPSSSSEMPPPMPVVVRLVAVTVPPVMVT